MADDALVNSVQRIPSTGLPASFCSASPPRRGGYTHVFFLSIAGRISISRADPDISGELTIVAAFTRHRARLKHNSFQRICLVGDMNLVLFLSLSFASEGFALHQHTFDSA